MRILSSSAALLGPPFTDEVEDGPGDDDAEAGRTNGAGGGTDLDNPTGILLDPDGLLWKSNCLLLLIISSMEVIIICCSINSICCSLWISRVAPRRKGPSSGASDSKKLNDHEKKLAIGLGIKLKGFGVILRMSPDSTPAVAEMRDPLDPARICTPRKYANAFPENGMPNRLAFLAFGISKKKLTKRLNIIGNGPEGRKLTTTPVYHSMEKMRPTSKMLDKMRLLSKWLAYLREPILRSKTRK